MNKSRILILALTMVGLGVLIGGTASAGMPERIELDNGLAVILGPIPGSRRVAVEACYRTGIIDEGKGQPQISHLVEHLACQAATKSFMAGKSFALLNADGRMANAETMLGFTHYDYIVPSADLDLALRIESERLTSLQITGDMIKQERPKCVEEFITVEQKSPPVLYKFAFMALNQAWRTKADTIKVKSGLEHASCGTVQDYHRAQYKTTSAAIVIVGDFDREKALAMVRKHFGGIPSGRQQSFFIDWERRPRLRQAQWDGKSGIVCIAYTGLFDNVYRYLLDIWGGLITEKLATDEQVLKLADEVYCGDPIQCLTKMPFYIYAATKPGVKPTDLQNVLESRLADYLDKAEAGGDIAKAIAYASEIGSTQVPSRDAVLSALKQMPPSTDLAMAEGTVMCQVALQFGFEEMLTRGHPATWMVAKSLNVDQVLSQFREMLDHKRKYVTVLTPMQESKP